MILALDYDDTYTQDPQLWQVFIEQAQKRGHQVMCVTWRNPQEPVDLVLASLVPVYYTSLKAKRQYMEQLEISIHVWIDDNPYAILHNYP